MAVAARGLARLSFSVNGRKLEVATLPMKRLLDVLREECGLTGTKEGCGEGECGACTVLMNGMPVNSCLVPAMQADGAKLMTVEGLARGGTLDSLQVAFIELGGAQCGICTPGMLLSAHGLIARNPGRVPGDAEVRDALAGNLCRCTGYQKIVDAVRAAAKAAIRPAAAARKPGRPAKRKAARKVAAPKRATTRKPARKRAPARKTAVPKKRAAQKPARGKRSR
jgi:carbon-monoxide dehydrogenase small subunit